MYAKSPICSTKTMSLHTLQSRMINIMKSSVLPMLGSSLMMTNMNTHRIMHYGTLASRRQLLHAGSRLLLSK